LRLNILERLGVIRFHRIGRAGIWTWGLPLRDFGQNGFQPHQIALAAAGICLEFANGGIKRRPFLR